MEQVMVTLTPIKTAKGYNIKLNVPIVSKLYADGIMPQAITEMTGIPVRTVNKILRMAGVKRRAYRKLLPEEMAHAIKLVETGHHISFVARRYNISRAAIYYALKQAGVTPAGRAHRLTIELTPGVYAKLEAMSKYRPIENVIVELLTKSVR